MVDRLKIIDWVGVWIEIYLIRTIMVLFMAVFGLNHVFLMFGILLYSDALDSGLQLQYAAIFEQNIGTVTTIAAVFIGIYFTVLSILGSLKVNSVLSVLSEGHLLKLINYLKSAMTASFLLLFYSLIIPAISDKFLKPYLFFALFFYMVMTAVRFGINIVAIYERDFRKLKENIEVERQEKEYFNRVIQKLDLFLQQVDQEKAVRHSKEMANILNQKQKEIDQKA